MMGGGEKGSFGQCGYMEVERPPDRVILYIFSDFLTGIKWDYCFLLENLRKYLAGSAHLRYTKTRSESLLACDHAQ